MCSNLIWKLNEFQKIAQSWFVSLATDLKRAQTQVAWMAYCITQDMQRLSIQEHDDNAWRDEAMLGQMHKDTSPFRHLDIRRSQKTKIKRSEMRRCKFPQKHMQRLDIWLLFFFFSWRFSLQIFLLLGSHLSIFHVLVNLMLVYI